MTTNPKSRRGFASLSPEKRREIASMGGKSVKPENRSFSKNPDLASRAGKIGGVSVNPNKRTFSKSTELAAAAGRKGGANSRDKRKERNI